MREGESTEQSQDWSATTDGVNGEHAINGNEVKRYFAVSIAKDNGSPLPRPRLLHGVAVGICQ